MRKTFIEQTWKNWGSQKRKEWEKNADFWITIMRRNLDPFRTVVANKAIMKSLPKRRGQKILDAGCGEGYLTRMLAKRGYRAYGVDVSEKLIDAAQQLEKEKPLGIRYFKEDMRKTHFPRNFFDGVISNQTIHEISNPERALQEFYRILKKKGVLIIFFLHPCFDVRQRDVQRIHRSFSEVYFQRIKIIKRYYLVGGIKSPSSYFYLHLPLSQWVRKIRKTGFLIKEIEEPRPPLLFLRKKKWWRKKFEYPRFILFVCQKDEPARKLF